MRAQCKAEQGTGFHLQLGTNKLSGNQRTAFQLPPMIGGFSAANDSLSAAEKLDLLARQIAATQFVFPERAEAWLGTGQGPVTSATMSAMVTWAGALSTAGGAAEALAPAALVANPQTLAAALGVKNQAAAAAAEMGSGSGFRPAVDFASIFASSSSGAADSAAARMLAEASLGQQQPYALASSPVIWLRGPQMHTAPPQGSLAGTFSLDQSTAAIAPGPTLLPACGSREMGVGIAYAASVHGMQR